MTCNDCKVVVVHVHGVRKDDCCGEGKTCHIDTYGVELCERHAMTEDLYQTLRKTVPRASPQPVYTSMLLLKYESLTNRRK